MTENEKPENVLDDVMRSLRLIYHRPFALFANRPQRWSFGGMVGAFVLLGLFAGLFSLAPWPQPKWVWWARLAILSSLLCYACMAVNTVATTIGDLRRVLPPERVLDPVMAAFPEELTLIARLYHTYEPRTLAYALDRLTLETTGIRARVTVLVGALDKVGLFPLAIGAYVSTRALFKEKTPPSWELNGIIAVVAALAVVYFLASGFLLWAQRLDEACLVLKYAGQAKQALDLPPEVG
jgi:hypothetical protein